MLQEITFLYFKNERNTTMNMRGFLKDSFNFLENISSVSLKYVSSPEKSKLPNFCSPVCYEYETVPEQLNVHS